MWQRLYMSLCRALPIAAICSVVFIMLCLDWLALETTYPEPKPVTRVRTLVTVTLNGKVMARWVTNTVYDGSINHWTVPIRRQRNVQP